MRAALLVQARKVGPIGRRVREVIARFLLDLRPAPDRADGCGNGGEQGCVTVGVAVTDASTRRVRECEFVDGLLEL